MGNKDIVVIFAFLIGTAFFFVILPFHVYFFFFVYFFAGLFPPPPPFDTKKVAEAYQQIPTPMPSIPLLKNNVWISTSCIICYPIHLIWGHNIHPHYLLTTNIPAYPV